MKIPQIRPIFSNRLKGLRNKYSIPLPYLAELLEIPKSSLSKFENQINTPSVDALYNIAKFFCVSTDYLLGRTNDHRFEFYFQEAEQEFFDDPDLSNLVKEQYRNDIAHNPHLAPLYLQTCRIMDKLLAEEKSEKRK